MPTLLTYTPKLEKSFWLTRAKWETCLTGSNSTATGDKSGCASEAKRQDRSKEQSVREVCRFKPNIRKNVEYSPRHAWIHSCHGAFSLAQKAEKLTSLRKPLLFMNPKFSSCTPLSLSRAILRTCASGTLLTCEL